VILAPLGCGGGESAPQATDPPAVSTSAGNGPSALVDPFIGTGDSDVASPVPNGKSGATFPGATVPFGMVQWSPDTPYAAPAGYHFGDTEITGFSLTHLNGAGCSAKRDFPVMPVVGAWDPSADPRAAFSHDAEIASPGFYEVTLKSGIRVDLTATRRTGLARFTFPADPSAKVLLSGGWLGDALLANGFEAQIHDDGTITGHRTDTFFCATTESYAVHFAARFDRPFDEKGIFQGGEASAGETSVSGPRSGVYVGFDTRQRHVVHMKVGISYVSEQGALANLDAENPGWDFDAVHKAAIAAHDAVLGRVEVEGGTDDERRAFTTALYHAFLQPSVASDADGQHMGMDGKVASDADHVRYADFSGWDVYRSWVQLASVLAPDETGEIMRSLVGSASECGALPKWSLESTETGVMVGDPADAVLASAHAFGVTGFNAQLALAAMVKGATDPSAKCGARLARPGLADYMDRHYCPSDSPGAPAGAPAVTLEYAVADFSIAMLAGALGDTAMKSEFLARGRYWQNLFDPARTANGFTGYIEPRLAADSGGKPAFVDVDVGKNEGFVEGNATQYTFFVPHDMPGLIAALGGDGPAIARLDSLFTKLNAGLDEPYFYMGNEPEFGTPWEYAFAGAPARSAAVVRRILTEAFSTAPGGLPGNDDLGATSSWQVWAMLGLYPAVPGVAGLVVGSPLFPKVTVHLANGKDIVITAKGAGAKAPYVQSLRVNGKATTSAWVSWDSLSQGGTLDFELGETPHPTWGTGPDDRPPAFYP
jgi:predicted alpha-1,2-mannosidase